MRRVWMIKAINHLGPTGEPYYDRYLFIGTQGENKRKVELLWRYLYEATMFDGTELTITYLHEHDTVELTARQIAQISGTSQFLKT